MTDDELCEAFSIAPIYLATYLSSFITSTLVFLAFMNDIYFGTPYAIKISDYIVSQFIISIIIAAIWSSICLWPLVLFITHHYIRFIHRYSIFVKPYAWALSGALLGIPVMFFYAFFLRLGFTKWIELSATGMVCGLFCASLSWGLIRLQIYNRSIRIDPE